MPLFVLFTLIEIALLVHVVKTGRSCMWFCVVLMLPVAGSLAPTRKEQFVEARDLYRGCRTGFLAHDPDILRELVKVELALEAFVEARKDLTTLQTHNTTYKNKEVPLLDGRL
ncbi:MAG: hypothetical protein ACI9TH_002006 [Kiritimatiellia bacterium]|jgi:hypothetical protein